MNRFIPTTSSSLLVKHIPVILSDGALQEFFQHFGAKEIQLMKGKMHGTALLKFNEPHSARKALSDLNNLKLLNKQLVVDFAEEEKPAKKSTLEPTPAASNEQHSKQPEIGFPIAKNLGIDWPSPPYLEYSYPPPSRDIAENIVRLLFHVPKFYEQVLHLMNKMNLPPPFGPAFPMANRVKKSLDPTRKRKRTPESVNNTVEEFESESSESDLDEDEQNRDKKRSRKSNEAEQEEGARHIPIDHQQPASSILGPSIRAQGTAKPLQISFKTTQLQPPLANAPMMQQGPGRPMMVPGPGPNNMMPNMGNMPPNMMGQFNPYMPPNNGSNVNIPVEYIQGQATPGQVVGADVRNVITLQQLMANRQTVDEIRMMEKFKNYAPGEPSEKLFVRNLEKRVTIEDLKFIFGRYIPADDDMDKELDVKLMTTGRLKGQAFVTFTNIQRAQQALNEVNGYVLYDRPLVIEFGRKKE